MWTETPEGQKLIQEISKSIVSEIAPEEMDLFDELVEEYFRSPMPPDLSAEMEDDPAGFGLNEILIAVTPAATAMVNAVLNHLMKESISAAKDESADVVRKKIKKIFQNEEQKDEKSAKESSQKIHPLSKEQLEQVKKLARKQALQFGVKADKAEKLANALIGSLALGK